MPKGFSSARVKIARRGAEGGGGRGRGGGTSCAMRAGGISSGRYAERMHVSSLSHNAHPR